MNECRQLSLGVDAEGGVVMIAGVDADGMPGSPGSILHSIRAAESIRPHAPWMREQIIRTLALSGPMTCDALEERLGYRHQTCSARVHELAKCGRIVDSGRARTRSGRWATVWGIR